MRCTRQDREGATTTVKTRISFIFISVQLWFRKENPVDQLVCVCVHVDIVIVQEFFNEATVDLVQLAVLQGGGGRRGV